jgi:hypothetical protein
MISGATFSACRQYRYTLTRIWDESKPLVVFCGLNPSTADETEDDATVRRELGFARRWGFGRYVKVNAYSWMSTDPKGLWEVVDPVGEGTGHAIETWARRADRFVAAWGNHITGARQKYVLDLLAWGGVKPWVLKLTKSGRPHHPLRLPANQEPFIWQP